MKRIMLVDYMGSVHYHWHRKEKDPCYQFLLGLRAIINQWSIHKTFILLEGGKSAYRLAKYPEYKAQREENRKKWSPAEQEAYKKFKRNATQFAKEVLPLFGLELLQVWGCEADDLAAYLADQVATQEYQVMLLSSDKDWHQLLRHGVVQGAYGVIMNAGFPSPPGLWMGRKAFEEKFELQVDQWIWAKCLAGDDGDNVKGFNGVGEGTALKLLQKYGSIEGIKADLADIHVPRMTAKAKADMQADFDRVYRNYELMNLKFSAQEAQDVLGSVGVRLLLDTIENLHVDKKLLDKDAISEVSYENGWLELLEDSFLEPFM